MLRMSNTALVIKNDPTWAKVGKRHYIHISGNEVIYDCNCWVWRLNGKEGYSTLWAAKYAAENSQTKKEA
jgi:hypothetical protein